MYVMSVPFLLGKFPATDWRPVLEMEKATCQPNVTEIGSDLVGIMAWKISRVDAYA